MPGYSQRASATPPTEGALMAQMGRLVDDDLCLPFVKARKERRNVIGEVALIRSAVG